MNFAILWLFVKVIFSEILGAWHLLAQQKETICKSFLENCIFHKLAKIFSLESFPLKMNINSVGGLECL